MKRKISLLPLIIWSIVGLSQTNHWTQVGLIQFPKNNSSQTTGMGRICSMTHHPTDSNIVFAISSQGGLFRSLDGGVCWAAMTDNFPVRSRFACFTLNHKNTNTMYLGTGDPNVGGGGAGIWKSVNGGKTWFQINKGIEKEQIYSIIIHQNDTNQLAALSRQGVYKSYDGGLNWTRKTNKPGAQDMITKPNSITGLYYCSAKDFSYSDDFGETWTSNFLSNNDTMDGILICGSGLDSNLLYALAWRGKSWGSKTHFGGLYKSKDGGRNWTKQSDKPQILGYSGVGASDDGQGRYNMALTVDPNDAGHLFIGAINLWESKDSGKTWILNSHWGQGIHADKHHLSYSPQISNKLFVSHDGGIDLSRDNGKTWENASNFLGVTEFYHFAQSPIKKELMVGGTQDNGKYFYMDSLFINTGAGDVIPDFVFPDKDTFFTYSNGSSQRYHVYEQKYYNLNGIISNPTFEQNRQSSKIFYMCEKELYRTDDINAVTVTWNKLSDPAKHYGSIGTVDIESCKSNSNMLYWGKTNNAMYLIRDVNSNSPSFTLINIPSGTLQQITTHAKDSNVVYITVSDVIYRSDNKGAAWTKIQYDLPAMDIIKFILDDKMTDSSMYVATALRVYYRNKNMKYWMSIQTDRPVMALITDMEMYNDSTIKSCLRVSTYGRGIWQTSLQQFQNSAPEADFNIQRQDADCPDVVVLNDVSLGGQYKRRWQILPYGSYQYRNGTDSLSAMPDVYLKNKGEYLFTLFVENANGKDSITKVLFSMKEKVFSTCNAYTKNLGNYQYGPIAFEFSYIKSQSRYSTQEFMNTENHTCGDFAHVRPGETYLTAVTNKGVYKEFGTLFIDYNNDGDFSDVNERVLNYPQGLGRRTGNVTILQNPPVIGQLIRMRLVTDNKSPKTSCDTLNYGQAEDYLILIDTAMSIKLNVPKPKVYGNFKVNIQLGRYCPVFDPSKIKVSNGNLLQYRSINALMYELTISPQKPGMIVIELESGAFYDRANNSNLAIKDSTLFEMGLISYSFPVVTKRAEIMHNDTGGVVNCYVFKGTDRSSLVAIFTVTDSTKVFIGNTMQSSNSTANNFNNPVLLSLKTSDGSFKKTYTINVIELPDTACELLSFTFTQPVTNGVIQNQMVNLLVPYGTSLNNRVAYTAISKNASIKVGQQVELSGVTTHDFRQDVLYRVIAEDSNYYKDYKVHVDVQKNTECQLLSWEIVSPSTTGNIIQNGSGFGYIGAKVPFKTDLSMLQANFKLSDSASMYINTIKQQSNTGYNNYTDTVLATVISQDGNNSKSYKISVNREYNDECLLLNYDLIQPASSGNISIADNKGKVVMTIPYKQSRKNLVGKFILSDSAILTIGQATQISGKSANDFTDTLTAKVMAQNGVNFMNYDLIVKYDKNDSCEMHSFSIKDPSANGVFTRNNLGGNIEVTVPLNTDLSKLVAIFTVSDSAIVEINGVKQSSGDTENDFKAEITYTVWSQSRKFKKEYSALVTFKTSLPEYSTNNFEVYPNPAGDYATIKLPYSIDNYTVTIIDNCGNVLLTFNNTNRLDVKDLKSGGYTVQIHAGDKTFTGKLIKR